MADTGVSVVGAAMFRDSGVARDSGGLKVLARGGAFLI